MLESLESELKRKAGKSIRSGICIGTCRCSDNAAAEIAARERLFARSGLFVHICVCVYRHIHTYIYIDI